MASFALVALAPLWGADPLRGASPGSPLASAPLGSDPKALALGSGPQAWIAVISGGRLQVWDRQGQRGWRSLDRVSDARLARSDGSAVGLERSQEGGGSRSCDPGATPLVTQGRWVLIGAGAGLLLWEIFPGGITRRRQRLDGRPVVGLAADADGQRVYATQGRSLWLGALGTWERQAPGPAGPWLHLAAHPERPGWLLAGDGRGLYRSTDGGRRFTALRGEVLPGAVKEARFAACPSGTGAKGALLVRSSRSVWRGSPGAKGQSFLPLGAPRAILEAHRMDPAVYVLAGRLYRWPCGPGARPEVVEIPASDVVALHRDPLRPGRIWLLGSSGLRALVARTRFSRPGTPGAADRPRTRDAGQGCPPRPEVAPRGNRPARVRRVLANALGRARRAAWLPEVSLHGRGLLRDGHGREAGRRFAHSFGLYLSLRWPLEAPAAAILADEAARAEALRADNERHLARQTGGCTPPRGGLVERWALVGERAALGSYYRREAASRSRSRQGGEP